MVAISTVIGMLGASLLVTASPVRNGKETLENILDSSLILSDSNIVDAIVTALEEASSSNDTCSSCINRLAIGKSLSLVRPDLIPSSFDKWCIKTKYSSNSTCDTNFARNTIKSGTTGSNFADMLQLMDPFGYDGALYCHYKDNAACPKPATPNVTLSHLWPSKQAKHYVAPEPSVNDTFNVLHVSDFHVELDYEVGAEANCTSSMCCTPHSVNALKKGNPESYKGVWNSFYEDSHYDAKNMSYIRGDYVNVFQNTSIWAPATTFGNYQCDSPEVLINSSLNSVIEYSKANDMDFEFAIFTGDLVDHDETKYTDYQLTVESEEVVLRDLKSRLGSIPVYPVLGNHDSYPYGELGQEGYGFSNKFTWNAELLGDIYEDYNWLNASTAQYTRKHYTGFAVDTKMGLKVISLNSNCFYKKNHYAYWNATNPDTFGQWEFLIDELVQSEAKNQRVWIIAHIPPATDGLPLPSKIFTEIIERFSPYTIAGIFFGHTHYDQFNLLYAGTDANTIDNVINFAWISQSITPFIGNNPSWRYYEVDKKTFSIMNGFNFYTKLNETYINNGSEPTWEFEYSSREGYNISWPETSPLNATYWHLVAEKVRDDVTYRQLYENYSKRWSYAVPNCSAKGNCLTDYCTLANFNLDDYDSCIAKLSS